MEVVEERYLGRLCGIPICSNAVVMRPFQKYRIDRINKKVRLSLLHKFSKIFFKIHSFY